MNLHEFNHMPSEDAIVAMEQCCAAPAWIKSMIYQRPFDNLEKLKTFSADVWSTMDEENLLHAFLAHPKIGNVDSLHSKFSNTKTIAAGEQSSVNQADFDIIKQLAEKNERYYDKFGFIFIVFATGKSAGEMLSLLESRLPNDRQTELQNAASEQGKITQLRLQKLFGAS